MNKRQPDDARFMSSAEDIERMEQERRLWLLRSRAERECVANSIVRRRTDPSDPFSADRLRNEIVTGLRVPQDYGVSATEVERMVGGAKKEAA